MGDAITVMEHTGMARRVPTPPFPTPADHGASSAEYDDWRDASDRGHPTQPSVGLADYLDALDRHQRANYDAHVIPVHKLWTNDGWLLTPDELAAARPHAPTTATDRRQRPIPWWAQWLDYLVRMSTRSGPTVLVRSGPTSRPCGASPGVSAAT
jgi:hypothetical protein